MIIKEILYYSLFLKMEQWEKDFYGEKMIHVFNYETHSLVRKHNVKYQFSHPNQWISCGVAWDAMFWRFRSMVESGNYSIESIVKSTAPNFEERYLQERNIFEFFSNALSTIEIAFYSLYCMASMKNSNFKFESEKTLRNINPRCVIDLFKSNFNSNSLTKLLEEICEDQNYLKIKEFRDFFSHRGTMNRNHYIKVSMPLVTKIASNPKQIGEKWMLDIELNEPFIKSKCDWTVKIINLLISEIEEFTKS